MKYAIARIGGKQLKLSEGETFEIERQKALKFEVIYYSDGDQVLIGNPVLEEVEIRAGVIEEKKGLKVNIGRFRAKSRYQKSKSHRQPLSVIKVDFIGVRDKKQDELKQVQIEPKVRRAKLATPKPVVKIVKAKEVKPVTKEKK